MVTDQVGNWGLFILGLKFEAEGSNSQTWPGFHRASYSLLAACENRVTIQFIYLFPAGMKSRSRRLGLETVSRPVFEMSRSRLVS